MRVLLTLLIAARIFTNPNPEKELRQLFPTAAAFSPLGGEPLHYKVYGADPKANPAAPILGIAFWTTDMAPFSQDRIL